MLLLLMKYVVWFEMLTVFGSAYLLFGIGNIFVLAANKKVSEIIEDVLKTSANKSRIRPLLDEGRTLQIVISVTIKEFTSIKETEEEYSLICYLRETWQDSRLAFSGYDKRIILSPNQLDRIWTPDLIIMNSKSGSLHKLVVPNREISISSEGSVFYSQCLSMTLICRMALDMFPMDNQTCFIEFESSGYSAEHVKLVWDEDPVKLDDEVNLQDYELTRVTHEVCSVRFAQTSNFSCLKVYFHLKRRLYAYATKVYLPSAMIVVLSWLSFWIDPGVITARTSLSVVPIIAIITESLSVAKTAPSGYYTKASDVWLAVCFVFVFCAFLEYNIVTALSKRSKQAQPSNKEIFIDLTKDLEDSQHEKSFMTGIKDRLEKYREKILNDPARWVEKTSRYFFPGLFVFFNIIYWSYYLSRHSKLK